MTTKKKASVTNQEIRNWKRMWQGEKFEFLKEKGLTWMQMQAKVDAYDRSKTEYELFRDLLRDENGEIDKEGGFLIELKDGVNIDALKITEEIFNQIKA